MPPQTPPKRIVPAFKSTGSKPALTHDQIAACAQTLWQARGCPSGQDLYIWLDAQAQLRNEAQPAC